MGDNPFRNLPSVNDVIETAVVQELKQRHDHDLVVGAIRQELGVPVRYVGVGEAVDDLRVFDADEFVRALFAEPPNVIAGTGAID